MKRFKFTIMLTAILLASLPLALAQGANGYNDHSPVTQSKNVPAGTVAEPGSQLLFVLDSGFNADAELGDDVNFSSQSVTELGGPDSAQFQNFISITNTNPSNSITVHFRYFNSDCTDIIDFLVLLTCNDTLLIDPFNVQIPGTQFNVQSRFFGSTASTAALSAIPAEQFGDGRFLLFVTASGDPTDTDNIADTLFPNELWVDKFGDIQTPSDCPGDSLATVGTEAGIDNDNLHILNSSAVAFDYLTGFHTVAIPTGFLAGDLPEGANDLAYGVTAFTRPSVDLTEDVPQSFYQVGTAFSGDGDGPQLPPYTILSGSEQIPVGNVQGVVENNFYLRNDVHGGDVWPVIDGDPETGDLEGGVSMGGALNWTLFPIQGVVDGALPSEQFINFVSIIDDYDGSGNPGGGFTDRSYGLDAADTFYRLTVFNNDEEALTPEEVIISPPPPGQVLEILVRCINAFTFTGDPLGFNGLNPVLQQGAYAAVSNLGDFSVEDLFDVGGDPVANFLAEPVDVDSELGPGWVRFDRTITGPTEGATPNGGTYNGETPSFATFGQNVVRFEGFGISYFLSTSATDFVSD